MFKHASLFSGMGGFDLAAEWMKWDNVFNCEINDFCRDILRYYWPEAHSLGDITKTDFKPYANSINILSGGFPCQPFSVAGKRQGTADERDLWPEMLRAIREIRPGYVVGENVCGIVNWSGGLVFDKVQTDLESEGFEIIPFLLPAASVNAPHRRERVFFIAYSRCNGYELRRPREDKPTERTSESEGNKRQRFRNDSRRVGEPGITTNAARERVERDGAAREQIAQIQTRERIPRRDDSTNVWANWPTQPGICVGNDGFPAGLDDKTISFQKWRIESLKASGNAVVPQVVLQIFKAIEQHEKQLNQNDL